MESPKELKVAIVGFAPSTRDLAPFGDPSFEIWGCNHLWPHIPRWDVWFDMHAPEWSASHLEAKLWQEHDEWLRRNHGGAEIFMLDARPEYPNVAPYPLDAVAERFGSRYFTCGPAYMVALALFRNAAEIHVYGMDMRHDTEYGAQRPCMEHWLGLARGLGVQVVIPRESALLGQGQPLYGYNEAAGAWAEIERSLLARREELRKVRQSFMDQQEAAMAQVHAHDGAIETITSLVQSVRERARGGVL